MFSEARTLSFIKQTVHLLCYSGRNNNYSGLQSPALLSLYLKKEQKKTKANKASTKPSELAFSCWTKVWQQELLCAILSRSCFVTAPALQAKHGSSKALPGCWSCPDLQLLPCHCAPGVPQVCPAALACAACWACSSQGKEQGASPDTRDAMRIFCFFFYIPFMYSQCPEHTHLQFLKSSNSP